MKYSIKLLLVIAALLLSHTCKANNFAKKNPKTLVQFDTTFCKSIGQNPIISICVSGEAREAEFNEHIFKALKNKTKNLIEKYKKSKQTVTAKFLEDHPCQNGPSAECLAFCTSNPTDSYCMMLYPPHPCEGGASPECANYCASNPSESICQTLYPPHPCASGPSPACSTFCASNPTDSYCMMLYPPSSCTLYDWDPNYCGAATYCDAHPNTPPECP